MEAPPNNPSQQQADELLATQKLLRATLDASMDMIQVFEAVRNQQGQIVDFICILNNHTSAKIYGDVIGKSLLLLQPGVVEEGIFDAFKLVVETGEPHHYEKQYVHEPFDGWFHQSVVKLNDGVATTTTDITDRKKAEQQVIESRDMLQALLDAPNTGISTYSAVRNPAGEITDFKCDFVNKRTLEAFQGHDPTGMLVSQFGADGVEQLPFFKAAIETGQKNTYTRKAESGIVEGWFLFSNAPLGQDRLSQVWEDITELKIAEQEILRLTDEVAQQATNKYYSIFNSIDEGFYLCEVLFDEAGKPVDILYLEENPAAVRMMGQSFVGKRLRAISPLYEEYWYQLWGDTALRGASQRLERYWEADQKWFNFLVSKFGGEASRQLTVTFQDITQRKRREASSRLINEVTEQLLQEERIDESITSVCQTIGVYFGAAFCALSELNEEQGTVQAPYLWHVPGVIAPTGVYTISEYHSAEVQALMRSNQPEIVPNSHDFPPAVAARYQALGIGSYVNLPFVRDGKWRATLTISKVQPYPWHPDEIDLMRDLTV
ncbi:MAG: hypothetical protein INR73_29255, partial [Williamsia sp.]|nr:hypothetical protein [Williamsia sp.]